jgi:hypothetical protein
VAFNELGGIRYLADLVDRRAPAAHAPDFGRLVYELAAPPRPDPPGRRDQRRRRAAADPRSARAT